jgi:hypothetical protein
VSINSLLNVTDFAIDSYEFEGRTFDCALFRGILFLLIRFHSFPHLLISQRTKRYTVQYEREMSCAKMITQRGGEKKGSLAQLMC